MSEAKAYIEDELGWSGEACSILSSDFARTIFEVESSGLEGVGYPTVLTAKDILSSSYLHEIPADASPFEVFDRLKRAHSDQIELLLEAFDKLGKEAKRILTLTGSIVGNFSQSDLRNLLESSNSKIGFMELDSPGELELEAGRELIGVPIVEDLGLDGSGQVVAVIDGEVMPHVGLEDRLVHKSSFSKHDWGEKPNHAGESFAQRHATSVATIIAGNGKSGNGQTARCGVCTSAEVWNYKIAPSTPNGSDVAAALEAAYLDGVKTINLSWGKKNVPLDGNGLWARTVDALFEKDVIVCKSAGNKGPDQGTVTTPADAYSVISVGSVDTDGTVVLDGSSRGPTLDGREKPELHSPGGGVWAGGDDNDYQQTMAPGTSFAAPFVAGAVLLIRQKHPNASAKLIRAAILASHNNSEPKLLSVPTALEYVERNT